MVNRTPEAKIRRVQRLYNNGEGLSVAEISRKTRVPYSTVYDYTRLLERGFSSKDEYLRYLNKYRTCRGGKKTIEARKRFGYLVREKREGIKISQYQAAKKVGVSREAWRHYERREYIPRGANFLRLCEFLDIEKKDLQDSILEDRLLEARETLLT
ncbi:MAG TPA: helix-turn-helix transcriptional regulator [Candidatus Paceibacterota bacterium]|nr:helix-turn-helix transcriptional regulator [Candidatus Paceibacterota bacterium]